MRPKGAGRGRPRLLQILLVLPALLSAAGCSPTAYVTGRLADAAAWGGSAFAQDDDLALVRDATPFALKAMEGLKEEQPRHPGLAIALARGFTQYGAAFVWQEAVEAGDPAVAEAGKERAVRLYLRARGYGLEGLEARHPGFADLLSRDPAAAAARAEKEDVPLLYWTAAAWSLAIAARPLDPPLVADLPRCDALIRRALALDEAFDDGAIHEFLVAFEGGRPEAMGGSPERAKRHYERALALADGRKVSPLVTYAETVAVREQDRGEFRVLLEKALSFDARGGPKAHRLSNLAAQRKARWLLGRTDDLFLE